MPDEPTKEETTTIEEKFVTVIERSPEFVKPLISELNLTENQTARCVQLMTLCWNIISSRIQAV